MSSRSKVRAILNQLDISPAERRKLHDQARRRARKSQFLWGEYLGYWVCVLLLIVGGAPGIIASLELLFGELPNPLRIVMLAGLILGLGWGAWWLFRRMNFGDTATPLMEILHERGYRWCRNCHYNLRSLPPETELCPECGTYISPHFTGDPDDAPPVQVRIDSAPTRRRMRNAIVHGIAISPAQLDQAWLRMREEDAERGHRLHGVAGAAIFLALMAGAILLDLWLERRFPDLSPTWTWLIVLGGFSLLFSSAVGRLIRLTKKRMTCRLRAALREIGVELCVRCGQYLGDLDPNAGTCPKCGGPREPFAPPEARAAEPGASPQPGRDDSL